MSPSHRLPVPRARRVRLVALSLAGALVAGGVATSVAVASSGGDEPVTTANADTATRAPEADAPASDTAASAAPAAVTTSPAVQAQLDYVREHWDDTESEEFGVLGDTDCVNFASQSLLARGWATDDEWWYSDSGNAYDHSDAWLSSTALMEYLDEHPERATALTDDERASVKVGDLVQFDWDDSGDRDHTGIVTSVTTNADGTTTILYAGHTDATFDRSVDTAITELHPGGTAYYWSIPE
ncbi:amidase domain-containing protein [Agromyces sp. ISL-38]|uniref:amidase domain-containing protein n=1 Tax=Agromyces sp. ISL-38 TaxID=2819107 RepID=UPI001BE83071|nr:amidase domain-containing protein [Agromyces sp. ISL-38]MBT2499461.1 amidase domain-containing protein [Agromyces sp. ISL-38]MBT2518007.1 amidase domain-containing protein [Streptomyces sp. ISL-90]